MEAIGVIPARYHSTRFEGKVLADILGKPMIQHVWENAKKARSLDDLIIAADDDRIIKSVKEFGGKAMFTSPAQPSGTDRLGEVVNPLDVRVVVNIQGDEPLATPEMIDSLAQALISDEEIVMATLITELKDPDQLRDPNIVKVAVDKNGFALYFSRSVIPFNRDRRDDVVYYKHIGMYAYTKDFLYTYTNLPESSLEKSERLEQLRVLENGYKIKCVETDNDTCGVDTAEDLQRVISIIKSKRG